MKTNLKFGCSDECWNNQHDKCSFDKVCSCLCHQQSKTEPEASYTLEDLVAAEKKGFNNGIERAAFVLEDELWDEAEFYAERIRKELLGS